MVLFSSILPYFTDPLIWIGIILLLIFLLTRYFLNNDIITQLPPWLDAELPRRLLKNGYVLGLLVVVLGIGLKYNQLSEAEQNHAKYLVQTEFNNNLKTIQQLSQNTQTLIASHQVVSSALRSGDSQIMNSLFPADEQADGEAINISKTVEAAFNDLKVSNLLKNEAAMRAFNNNKDRMKAIINPHNQALIEMQAMNKKQHVIHTTMWHDHKDVMVQIDDFDQQAFENNLSMMHAIKKQYALTLLDTSDYFTETLNFITRNTFIGNGPVFEILTKEQIAMQSLSAMHKDLKALLQALNSQQF